MNIYRYSAGEISNFSTDAQHLSKLGSQSAYALVGGDCNRGTPMRCQFLSNRRRARRPPFFILGIING